MNITRLLLTLILLTAMLTGAASARKFYDDDPILREPQRRDVGQLKSRKLSDIYDLFSLQFGDLGQRQPAPNSKKPLISAQGINTIENPFDDAWWQPRHYFRRMTLDELRRGPGNSSTPSTRGKWTIVGVKSEGVRDCEKIPPGQKWHNSAAKRPRRRLCKPLERLSEWFGIPPSGSL